jgi:hypothetical protein
MPHHQIVDMLCALQNKGVATNLYKVWTIPQSRQHAFHYWLDPIRGIRPSSSKTGLLPFLTSISKRRDPDLLEQTFRWLDVRANGSDFRLN